MSAIVETFSNNELGLQKLDRMSPELVATSVILYFTGLIIFLLFHDQIYPSQVIGKNADGNDITLTVCPEPQLFEEMYEDKVSTPIEPSLSPCVTYISARGLDRVQMMNLSFVDSLEV